MSMTTPLTTAPATAKQQKCLYDHYDHGGHAVTRTGAHIKINIKNTLSRVCIYAVVGVVLVVKRGKWLFCRGHTRGQFKNRRGHAVFGGGSQ